MNDTFDNFNFSSIQLEFSSPSIKSGQDVVEENAENVIAVATPPANISDHKNDVSFDDSQFFSIIDDPKTLTPIKINLPQIHTTPSSEEVTVTRPLPEGETLPSLNRNNRNHCINDNEHLCNISSWNLPKGILEKYMTRNITRMFPWQVECLTIPGVLQDHKNLVYSAPTSAGKTLVAEILAIKTVLERQLKSIIILPFVSVVREKMFYLQEILSSSGIRVDGFMGSYNPPGGFQSVQIAICTIEKANALINRLLQDGNLNEIGCVVVDEMHLLGDPNRGYLLELLLTKVSYISRRVAQNNTIQIIGMSATLPNLQHLAKWLQAELYVTNFRPIPLYEQAQVCGELYDNQLKLIRKLEPHPELVADTDNVLQLCLETILESCSVLIFCPTKNWCENLAQQIAQAFWKLGRGDSDLSGLLRLQIKSDLIVELLEQLKYCPAGLDEILQKTVSFGVAFHHAGLTMDERDIVEGAFRNGAIRVLVATSTLSSGVNLPAKRVIIRTSNFHGRPVDILTYRQMVGRAGRMGKDTSGESILICQKPDYKTAKFLLTGQLKAIESCLEGAGKLKRAVLEVVASGVSSTPEEVALFADCTLLAAQSGTCEDFVKEALEFLIRNEFIRVVRTDERVKYVATSLGKACLNSSIPPEEGLTLFAELEKARRCIVLESELHLIYLVTPYSACAQWPNLDWMFYLNLWEKLDAAQKRVGDLVGIEESYIVGNATRGQIQPDFGSTGKPYEKFLVHKRFFVALALQDLVDEKPLGRVAAKFGCNRGLLQSLQLTASTFAGMVTSFSKQLGWSSVELLVGQFQDRLQFGVARDLLDLMRLPLLNGKTARALYDAGYESLIQLANSDFDTIETVLHKAVPFQSDKLRDGESDFDFRQRTKLKSIWICGKEGLTGREAAELIVIGARNYLKVELGLKEAKWDHVDGNKMNGNNNKYADDGFSSMEDNNDKNKEDLESLQAFSGLNLSNSTKSNNSGVIDINNKAMSRSDESLFESSGDEKISDAFISTYCSTQNQEAKNNKRVFDLSANETPRKRSKFTSTPNQNQRNVVKADIHDDTIDLSKFEIINVSSHPEIRDAFLNEIKQIPVISLSMGCGKSVVTSSGSESDVHKDDLKCDGFAITWGDDMVYYLNNSPADLEIIEMLSSRNDLTIKMFDAHQQLKMFKKCCNIEFRAQLEDCKVADWILEPEGKPKNLQAMTVTYFPDASKLSQICGDSKGVVCVSLDTESSTDSRLRSCIEALLTWYLVDSTKRKLFEQNTQLLETLSYYGIEMRCRKILSKMECEGISVDEKKLRDLVDDLNKEIVEIEKSAYSFAGRRFSFTSPKEVSKILGLSFRGGGRRVTTKKEILENCKHPMARSVLRWRKMHHIVTKTIQPLVLATDCGKIYGSCILNTATGRVSMYEPNLQNVAKSFDLEDVRMSTISCRDCFIPGEGKLMLSADYCQLELRLLAYLSRDRELCAIMCRKGDVFKTIAAQWNNLQLNEVTDQLRQHAKQLCYGIIYGMGCKTLASQLKIDEKQAANLMRTFKSAYPGIQDYIETVLDFCRKFGYVETISGRRRYLPHIVNETRPHLKSQAERQAVNSTIQGSAADLVKRTMTDLEEQFAYLGKSKPLLVLQLHDELVYEVGQDKVKECAVILKRTMEQSPNVSIPFPVKMKWGKSWGGLVDYTLD